MLIPELLRGKASSSLRTTEEATTKRRGCVGLLEGTKLGLRDSCDLVFRKEIDDSLSEVRSQLAEQSLIVLKHERFCVCDDASIKSYLIIHCASFEMLTHLDRLHIHND